MTTTANSDREDVDAHQRADLIDRRDHDAGESRERHAEAVSQHDHARHVDAEGLRQRRILGRGAQGCAEPRAFDQEPCAETHRQRKDDDPDTVGRQEDEPEIEAAMERVRDIVGPAGIAVALAKGSLDEERQAERQQEAVDVIEMIDAPQDESFEHEAGRADDERRDDQ